MNGIFMLLSLLISHAPKVTADGVKMYADIAHGEGGLAKVQTAVNDLAKVVNDAVAG